MDSKRRKVRIFPGRCEVSVATVEATRSRDDGEPPSQSERSHDEVDNKRRKVRYSQGDVRSP